MIFESSKFKLDEIIPTAKWTMRLSLRRIVAQIPSIRNGNCIRCHRIYLPISNIHRTTAHFQFRGYADDVKDPESKEESPGVKSTGIVPEDPDIITTESHEIQNPPPSPNPPSEGSSPSRPAKTARKWRPKYSRRALQNRKSRTTQNSARQQSTPKPKSKRQNPAKSPAPKPDLLKTLSETSLRKRLIWHPPLTGINPAYDMALAILKQDRAHKFEIIKRLKRKLAQEQQSPHPPRR